MNIKSIYKIGVVLFSIMLLTQTAYAVCDSMAIRPFVDGQLHPVEQHSTRTGKEVCIYKIKYSREDNAYYMYTLLDGAGIVVYCGITNDPQRRTREHSDTKNFYQMIATGYFTRDIAIDKEKACVCEYHPVLNKLPSCQRHYGGGVNPEAFFADGGGLLYQLELE